MANIGEQLSAPESGWKRIDDTDSNIVYNGTWNTQKSSNYYNSSSHYTNENTAYISFKYYGTKIRLLMIYYSTKTDGNVIEIDGTKYYFNCSNSMSSGNGTSNLAFEKTGLNKKVHNIKIYAPNASISKSLHIDAIDIDEDGKLLSQEEYNKMMSCYIKQGDKYYSFSKDNYDTTTKMYREITLDDINNDLYLCKLTDLTKEVTIGEETFKPIDKFDNFQFVSKYNEPKTIIGRKSKTGMSIASGDIYTKVTSRINSFTLDNTVNNNSYIRMAVSFDNGITWKTYKDKKFTDLSINIAIKTYENMTTDEKNNWKSAKETILSEGFTPDILSTIDFNSIEDLNTIRFAYVLYQDLSTDTCEVNNLSWQFDAKGSFQKMKDNELTTSFSNGIINITPNENQDMIITNYIY